MGRIGRFFVRTGRGMLSAAARYPLPVACFAAMYAVAALTVRPVLGGALAEALLIALAVLAAFGLLVNAVCERLAASDRLRLLLNACAVPLGAAYYLLSFGTDAEVVFADGVRAAALVFAFLCLYLWIPSAPLWGRFRGREVPFPQTAMICFKAFFVTVLYMGVASLGLLLINAAIGLLLFPTSGHALRYALYLVSVFLGPFYLLSLLPRFQDAPAADREESARCPRFLEILLAYIVVPLMGLLTVVFYLYLLKILVTQNWPSGEIGPMVLSYSAAGLAVYVLSAPLQNRFSRFFGRFFPVLLAPLVVVQIVSVIIRIRAYGFTEARYYLLLTCVLSIAASLLLGTLKERGSGVLFALAALLALFSLVPPIDAFTVSRESQESRLSLYLSGQGLLTDGVLTPKAQVQELAAYEITDITTYLYDRGYTGDLPYLPENFDPYAADGESGSFSATFGFSRQYSRLPLDSGGSGYLSIALENGGKYPGAVTVTGFDALLDDASFYDGMGSGDIASFVLDGRTYSIRPRTQADGGLGAGLYDGDGQELLAMDLSQTARMLLGDRTSGATLSEQALTAEYESGAALCRVVFKNIGGSRDAQGVSNLNFLCRFLIDIR